MKIIIKYRNLIPSLTNEEYLGLEQSLLKSGCLSPLIITKSNVLLDGHNRYEICQRLHIDFDTKILKDIEGELDEKIWILFNQAARRNLTIDQRSSLALQLKDVLAKKAKEKQKEDGKNLGGNPDKTLWADLPKGSITPINAWIDAAKAYNIGETTLKKHAKIIEKSPEKAKEIREGKKSIDGAFKEIKKEEKQNDIKKLKDDIAKGKVELPKGMFEIIVIDPPWKYGTDYDSGGRRVASPYPEMDQSELMKIILPASSDCILYLWTTHKFIFDANELLKYWGFDYRNILVWDKDKIGMGNLYRMQCEFCLVGIKGKPKFDNNNKHIDIFREKGREHSRKPEQFYTMVNELCIGRKLDYFSREKRSGWENHGIEINKF